MIRLQGYYCRNSSSSAASREASVQLFFLSFIQEELRKDVEGVGGLRLALTFYRLKRRYAQASITKIIWCFFFRLYSVECR